MCYNVMFKTINDLFVKLLQLYIVLPLADIIVLITRLGDKFIKIDTRQKTFNSYTNIAVC